MRLSSSVWKKKRKKQLTARPRRTTINGTSIFPCRNWSLDLLTTVKDDGREKRLVVSHEVRDKETWASILDGESGIVLRSEDG